MKHEEKIEEPPAVHEKNDEMYDSSALFSDEVQQKVQAEDPREVESNNHEMVEEVEIPYVQEKEEEETKMVISNPPDESIKIE